jgi:hypothetical protein
MKTLIIDPLEGSHVLDRKFDKIITTYRANLGDNFIHQTVGTIKYSHDWLVIDTDDEICRYYAAIVEKKFGVKLHWKSMWGGHVSVIRGEELLANQDKWGYNEGREITIQYSHDIYTNGQHWWLNVKSKEISDLRTFYGLPENDRNIHLTMGRI